MLMLSPLSAFRYIVAMAAMALACSAMAAAITRASLSEDLATPGAG